MGLVLSGAWTGCAEPTSRTYIAALHASDWPSAEAGCRRIRPVPLRAECLVAVMEAHEAITEERCEEVPDGKWQEECIFLLAEQEAAAGRMESAFAACNRTGFGRECAFHLVREGARAARDLPPAEAAMWSVGWDGLESAPDAATLFWKAWFREQLVAERPINPAECPNPACIGAAREVLFTTLASAAIADAGAMCITRTLSPLLGARLLWESGPLTDRWVAGWTDKECGRRRIANGGDQAFSPGPP